MNSVRSNKLMNFHDQFASKFDYSVEPQKFSKLCLKIQSWVGWLCLIPTHEPHEPLADLPRILIGELGKPREGSLFE